MPRGTDIPAAIDESRGCKGSLANTVDMEQVELASARRTNVSPSSLVKKILPSTTTGDAETLRIRSAKAILPECSPRLRIERSGNACHIVDHVQVITVENRGWNKG